MYPIYYKRSIRFTGTNSLLITLLMILFTILFNSCSKETAFLDAKPSQSLVVPTSLTDLQNLLNYEGLLNKKGIGLGFIAGEDFYVDYSTWLSASTATERNTYIWASDIYQGESGFDWDYAYQKVYYSNVVLDRLNAIQADAGNQVDYNQVKGSALFFRAYTFNDLAQNFAKPYDSATAKTDLGIPLRLNPDPNSPTVRSTVQETYDLITQNLKMAANLLPVHPIVKTRPSQAAAYGLLARVYLSMRVYDSAFKYSNQCLAENNSLLDFNLLDSTASYPIAQFNNETIFFDVQNLYYLSIQFFDLIDSGFYQSYSSYDLRRPMFFSASSPIGFIGSYSGSLLYFDGLATDELYLIRAECNARSGKTTEAMNDLNDLLITRYATGHFTPLTASNAGNALDQILTERRKELVLRGLRWSDLRRLNKDPHYAVTLTRTLNGQTYSLPPNDNKYVFPIPDDEIKISGIPQNPR